MPDYRRFRVPGGTYFFTVNLLERWLDTLVRHVDALREAVRVTRRERPFHIDVMVILPNHLHAVRTPPEDAEDFLRGNDEQTVPYKDCSRGPVHR